MYQLWQDVKYASRTLRKSPAFTVIAVLTLALGIGANTAIFSLINGLMLHPAGISDPGHVVAIQEKYDKLNLTSIPLSPPNFADVRDSRSVFSSAAAIRGFNYNYASEGNPQALFGFGVTSEWLEVFGAKPLLGRAFRPEEDQPAANHVTILAYDTWQRTFGGDRAIIGKSMELNGESYRIVGVMGPEFVWAPHVQLWVPLGLPSMAFADANRFNENLVVFARTRPGVSQAQAESFIPLLAQRIMNTSPSAANVKNAGWGMFAEPVANLTYGDLTAPMLVLWGAVGFVLLIACANIAGLVLARVSGRTREFAIRTAMGSTRWRLVRQALTESLLLAGAGTLLGLLFAGDGIRVLLDLAPQNEVRGIAIHADGYVLAFTAVVGLLSGVFFGIAPAWQIGSRQNYELLKEGGRSGTTGRERLRLRSLLVVSEVALALILLVGAGLFLKSFARLQRVNHGLDPSGVMTAQVALPAPQYDSPEKRISFDRAVLERLAHMPGVSSAAASAPLPFSEEGDAGSFNIEGRTIKLGDPGPHSDRQWVTPDYFKAMSIPLRAGRYFTDQDREGTQPVVVIDENLARQYWPGEDPVGKRIRVSGGKASWTTIVGVVGRVSYSAMLGGETHGMCYYPAFQDASFQFQFLIAKTSGGTAGLAAEIREAVRSVDPAQPVSDMKSMDERVEASLGAQHFVVSLLGFFAAVALLMAALGLYGVISYSVAQRTQEIGIRVALGAQREQVLWHVLGHGLRLACAGIAVGVLGALFLVHLIASQLFETRTFDPLTFVGTALLLLGTALLACYIPARRALRVDPMVALRHE